MRKVTLHGVLGWTLGRLTADPVERANTFWRTVAVLCGNSAAGLSTLTMLTAYLERSGFSNTEIGFISSSMPLAYMGSMFLLMGAVDRTQKRIRVLVLSGYVLAATTAPVGRHQRDSPHLLQSVDSVNDASMREERTPSSPPSVAVDATILQDSTKPTDCMPLGALFVALIVVLALNQPALALAGMMDYNLLVRSIRVEIRGRVIAIGGVVSGLFGILLALFVGMLLKQVGHPYGYTVSFLMAAGFYIIRSWTHAQQEELPDIALPGTSRSALPFTAIVDVCKLKEFRMLAYPHVMRGLLTGLMVFVVNTQMKRLELGDEYAGYMTAVVSAAGLLASVVLGLTLDRWGAGIVALLGGILTGLAWAAVLVSPTPIWFLIFFLILHFGDVLEQRAIPLGCFEIVPAGVVGGFTAARLLIMYGTWRWAMPWGENCWTSLM